MLKQIVILSFISLPAAAAAQAPDDWTWRLDAEQTYVTGAVKPGEWAYQRMPPGWHVTTTQQGAVLFPKQRTVQGRWAVEVELFLFPNPSASGLGIVLDSVPAGASGTQQLRFLMRRDGSGTAVVMEGDTERELAPWKRDTTVAAHDGSGVIKYVLRLSHEAGMLAFAINGAELFAGPGGGGDRPIVPGLRVGAGLNLHVSRFDLVTPLAPPRARRPTP